MTTQFPKYFAIKCPADYKTNTTWKNYMKWLNTYAEKNGSETWDDWSGDSVGSYYGTENTTEHQGTNMNIRISQFEEGTVEITLKQWDSEFNQTYIKKSKTQKTHNMATPTKDQILEAAKTSPEAKQALAKLFPDYFKPKLNDDIHAIPSETLSYETGVDDLCKFLKTKGNAIVCLGIAPNNKNLENKVVDFNNHQDMVVFDKYTGEELHRIHMDRVVIGFADHK